MPAYYARHGDDVVGTTGEAEAESYTTEYSASLVMHFLYVETPMHQQDGVWYQCGSEGPFDHTHKLVT